MHILDELDARGLVADVTDRAGLAALLSKERVTFYCGYDPTASSLHVGNLVPLVVQARLQRDGHKPIVLVGGATGMIGDPSGKSIERNLLGDDELDANVAGIRKQLERFLDFAPGPNAAKIVNNADWTRGVGYLEFLRDVGKYLTVNYMMAKDSVRARLEGEAGISYTEFSYMLLQAFDFVHLAKAHGCRLQVGGSDQYGNITAGCELSRKMGGAQLFGLTQPLLLDSSGQKMGKTSTGERIWLDPELTSPYEFYQFWFNADDRDAARYLKFFTFLDEAAISVLEAASAKEPEKRHAQRELAREVTRLVHGATAVQEAETAAEKLFKGDLSAMSVAELLQIFPNVPSCDLASVATGWLVPELLAAAGVASSNP